MSASSSYDVIVIGAGIIGAAIAWELNSAGRRVTIVDRGDPGMGCSYGNAAHFATEQIFPIASPAIFRDIPRLLVARNSPLTFNAHSLLSTLRWSLRFLRASNRSSYTRGTRALAALNAGALSDWQALLSTIGQAQLLHRTGTLQLAESRRGVRELAAMQVALSEHEVPSRMVGRDELPDYLPQLPDLAQGGLYFPETAYCLDPYLFFRTVFDACLANGVSFHHANVSALDDSNRPGVTVVTDSARLQANTVIVAGGVHSGELLRPLGHRIPLIAERGYHLLLPHTRPTLKLPVTLHERQFIMTPLQSGIRLAGTVEFASPDDPPSMQRAQMLYTQANEVFGGLDATGSSQWMGCRPTLPDYLPVIDAPDNNRSLIVATGNHHLGLTQAATVARCVRHLAQGTAPPVNLADFRLSRF
ncbi:MAG: FAD-dependent oxidoreductase [Halioglobus sp.]|nr:FAD-dependent oxidoreductase [Halioglobus sp.]|tara:strand:- start:594 stop:1844 length:1251 start_codon:yes stop_codon:yes gene_type:complete